MSAESAKSAKRRGLICFRIDLSVYAAIRDFAPQGNSIGTLFLQRCVELMFDQAGVKHSGPGCFPQPLNQCAGAWHVDDVSAGVRVLEAALNYLDLLQERFTEIGYFDSREDFWRNTYPRNISPSNPQANISRYFEPGVFEAEMSERLREFSASVRKVMEALQS